MLISAHLMSRSPALNHVPELAPDKFCQINASVPPSTYFRPVNALDHVPELTLDQLAK